MRQCFNKDMKAVKKCISDEDWGEEESGDSPFRKECTKAMW